jgi:hypothetical protein
MAREVHSLHEKACSSVVLSDNRIEKVAGSYIRAMREMFHSLELRENHLNFDPFCVLYQRVVKTNGGHLLTQIHSFWIAELSRTGHIFFGKVGAILALSFR